MNESLWGVVTAASFQVTPWSAEENKMSSLILARCSAGMGWMGNLKWRLFMGTTSLGSVPGTKSSRANVNDPAAINLSSPRTGRGGRSLSTDSPRDPEGFIGFAGVDLE